MASNKPKTPLQLIVDRVPAGQYKSVENRITDPEVGYYNYHSWRRLRANPNPKFTVEELEFLISILSPYGLKSINDLRKQTKVKSSDKVLVKD